jgi:hypothetical protein
MRVNPKPILDRNRRKIEVGQNVRVKYCKRLYGPMRTIHGKIEHIDQDGGIQLRLAGPARFTDHTPWDNPPYRDYGPGSLYYVRVHTTIDPDTGEFIAYYKHDDFHDGHEEWVEIL